MLGQQHRQARDASLYTIDQPFRIPSHPARDEQTGTEYPARRWDHRKMSLHIRHDHEELLDALVGGKLPRNLSWSAVIELDDYALSSGTAISCLYVMVCVARHALRSLVSRSFSMVLRLSL